MIRAKTFVPRVLPLLAGLLWLSAAAPRAHANSLLFWDFENATSSGSISTATGVPQTPGISGYASQTGGGPAENFGGSLMTVHITRFFGTYYPFLSFTLTHQTYLQSVTFDHIHNHNSTGFSTDLGPFPTYPSYYAQLQISTGAGFADIGSPLLLEGSNVAHYGTSVDLGIFLEPGNYQLRWVPQGLHNGAMDTNTEYFALNNVSLNGILIAGVNALFAQSGSGKAYKLGSTIPIKLQLLDGNGNNVSSPALVVHATGLTTSGGGSGVDTILDSGNANPDSDFRYDATLQGYIFNLSTKNLPAGAGTWKLTFSVNGHTDPSYVVSFDVK